MFANNNLYNILPSFTNREEHVDVVIQDQPAIGEEITPSVKFVAP